MEWRTIFNKNCSFKGELGLNRVECRFQDPFIPFRSYYLRFNLLIVSQKVFKSHKNQIILTDDFLVFDKNKSIHFDHLLVVRMSKGSNSAFVIIGQYRPGRWFTYLNIQADDFVTELLSKPKVNIIEKEVVKSPKRWKRSGGWLDFSDGTSLHWYPAEGASFLFFEEGNKRLGYQYIPLIFNKRNFKEIVTQELPEIDWLRGDSIVLFDPWANLQEHFESIEAYKNTRTNKPDDDWNEPYGSGVMEHIGFGCLGVIAVFALIILLVLIMS